MSSEANIQTSSIVEQRIYQQLCYRHLCRKDTQLAQYYWSKIENACPQKMPFLPAIITCLLSSDHLSEAEHYFYKHQEQLPHLNQLQGRFALVYLQKGNLQKFDSMIEQLSNDSIKQLLLFFASVQYPEYAPRNAPNELIPLMSDEEFIEAIKISTDI